MGFRGHRTQQLEGVRDRRIVDLHRLALKVSACCFLQACSVSTARIGCTAAPRVRAYTMHLHAPTWCVFVSGTMLAPPTTTTAMTTRQRPPTTPRMQGAWRALAHLVRHSLGGKWMYFVQLRIAPQNPKTPCKLVKNYLSVNGG